MDQMTRIQRHHGEEVPRIGNYPIFDHLLIRHCFGATDGQEAASTLASLTSPSAIRLSKMTWPPRWHRTPPKQGQYPYWGFDWLSRICDCSKTACCRLIEWRWRSWRSRRQSCTHTFRTLTAQVPCSSSCPRSRWICDTRRRSGKRVQNCTILHWFRPNVSPALSMVDHPTTHPWSEYSPVQSPYA